MLGAESNRTLPAQAMGQIDRVVTEFFRVKIVKWHYTGDKGAGKGTSDYKEGQTKRLGNGAPNFAVDSAEDLMGLISALSDFITSKPTENIGRNKQVYSGRLNGSNLAKFYLNPNATFSNLDQDLIRYHCLIAIDKKIKEICKFYSVKDKDLENKYE